jgi:menaquinone-dependent protoporphyrinogen oxidase
MKVLVTAASRYGATAQIAAAIADELAGHGLEVEVAAPSDVGDIGRFGALVLGSAVYAGHWLEPATALVARHRDRLSGMPVWLFSSGPVGDPARRLVRAMGADPAELSGVRAATGAIDHRMFAGRLDRRRLTRAQRCALAVVRGLEGDFRDWDAIRAWSAGIADALTRSGSP